MSMPGKRSRTPVDDVGAASKRNKTGNQTSGPTPGLAPEPQSAPVKSFNIPPTGSKWSPVKQQPIKTLQTDEQNGQALPPKACGTLATDPRLRHPISPTAAPNSNRKDASPSSAQITSNGAQEKSPTISSPHSACTKPHDQSAVLDLAPPPSNGARPKSAVASPPQNDSTGAQGKSPITPVLSAPEYTHGLSFRVDEGLLVDLEQLLRKEGKRDRFRRQLDYHRQKLIHQSIELKSVLKADMPGLLPKQMKQIEATKQLIKKLEQDFLSALAELKTLGESHRRAWAQLVQNQETAMTLIEKLKQDNTDVKANNRSNLLHLNKLDDREDERSNECKARISDLEKQEKLHAGDIERLYRRTECDDGEDLRRVVNRESQRLRDVTDDVNFMLPKFKDLRMDVETLRKGNTRADVKDLIERVHKHEALLDRLSKTVKTTMDEQTTSIEANITAILEELQASKLEFRELSELTTALTAKLIDQPKGIPDDVKFELVKTLRAEVMASIKDELLPTMRTELKTELESDLRQSIKSDLRKSIEELLPKMRTELKTELESDLRKSIKSDLRKSIEAEVHKEVEGKLRNEMDSKFDQLHVMLGKIILPKAWAELKERLPQEIDNHLVRQNQAVVRSQTTAACNYPSRQEMADGFVQMRNQSLLDIIKLRQEWDQTAQTIEDHQDRQDMRVEKLNDLVVKQFKIHKVAIEVAVEEQRKETDELNEHLTNQLDGIHKGLHSTSQLVNTISKQQAIQKLTIDDFAMYNNFRGIQAAKALAVKSLGEPSITGLAPDSPSTIKPEPNGQAETPVPTKSTSSAPTQANLDHADNLQALEERLDKVELGQKEIKDELATMRERQGKTEERLEKVEPGLEEMALAQIQLDLRQNITAQKLENLEQRQATTKSKLDEEERTLGETTAWREEAAPRLERAESDYHGLRGDFERLSQDLTTVQTSTREDVAKIDQSTKMEIRGLKQMVEQWVDQTKPTPQPPKTVEPQPGTPRTANKKRMTSADPVVKRSPSFDYFSVKRYPSLHLSGKGDRAESPIPINPD